MKAKRRTWYFIKNYKFNSIFIKNFVLILMLVILPIGGTGFFIYRNMKSAVEEEISTISMNSLYKVRDVVDNIFRDMDRMATQISLTSDVNVFLLSSDTGYILENSTYKNINANITMFTLIYKYINSIYVYSGRRDFVISNTTSGYIKEYQDTTWYETYKRNSDNKPWIESRKRNDIYPYYLSLIRPAYLYEKEKLGAVIVNVDIEELGKLIANNGSQEFESVLIIDETGKIIYSNERPKLGVNIRGEDFFSNIPWQEDSYSAVKEVDSRKYVVSVTGSLYQKWRYISLFSLNHYESKLEDVGRFLRNFLIAGVLAAVFIAVLIAVRTFEPVKNILSVLDDPDTGNMERIEGKKENLNEIKDIAEKITKTIYSNKILGKELENRLTLLDRAQTTALQAQINPHFLFNTLDTIKWMAVRLTRGKNEVSAMITSLSELLRISLDTEEQLVSIDTEVEHAKLYVEIMKTRYHDKFSVYWEIDEEIRKYKIVKLSLQPLIENAIYHGIKPLKRNGSIRITGKIEKDMIIIQAADDGAGMDKGMADIINKAMQDKYEIKKEHIGVRNVNQRIKLILGKEYGLTIASGENQGTIVEIRLPKTT